MKMSKEIKRPEVFMNACTIAFADFNNRLKAKTPLFLERGRRDHES